MAGLILKTILKVKYGEAMRTLSVGFLSCAVLFAAGCRGGKGQPNGSDRSQAQLAFLDAAAGCIEAAANRFEAAATPLHLAAVELDAQPSPATLQQARARWREAMDVWQENDLMQVGPAALSLLPGGKNLRDEIYIWPLASPCRVDEVLISRAYEGGVATQRANARTLAALEYLLFAEGTDSACPPHAAIRTSGEWASLSPEDLAARRRAYARAVAADVETRAHQLAAAWRDGFAQTLRTPGSDNRVFASPHMALNSVSDALFYLEASVKDAKLAPALGLRACAAPSCLEMPFAHAEKEALAANLRGFRALAQGCGEDGAGQGLDDLLIASGATGLAERLLERTSRMRHALEAIEAPRLADALSADPGSVRAFHDAVKDVTDLLKSELITVLDLEIPSSIESDND